MSELVFFALAFIYFSINVSEECALPFWWNQQYNFQPFYAQLGQPKTTYRYREAVHRKDPNNFVHIQEYSEYTWWEHSTSNVSPNLLIPENVHHRANAVFGQNAYTHNFGYPRRFGLGPQSKINHINTHAKTNNIVPRGDTTGIISQEVNRKTIKGVKNISSSADIKRTRWGFTNMFPFEDSRTTLDLNNLNPFENSRTTPSANDMIPFDDSRKTTFGVNDMNPFDDSNGMVSNDNSNERSPSSDTNGIITEDDIDRSPSTISEMEFDLNDRERNENEDGEVTKVEEMVENDLEASSANRSPAKVKKPKSNTSFFGGWFGSENEDEMEPCKVTGTDIHSLRSMIENMFSSPREHIVHPESKEKVREDILNKFKNYGLQVWTQNFTTPLISNPNGTEEYDEGVNLIGVIPGLQRGSLDDGIVLVGAHYDTVADSNGVDDNGSGLAVMLEVARAITEARCRLNHTLMFVAFDHEENGAMGSNYFVDHYLIPEELKRARAKFQGAFILDGILNYNNIPNTQELPLDYAESLPSFQYFVNNTGNRGNFLAMISRHEMDNHLSKKLMDAWQDLGENKYKLYNLQVNMGNSIPEPSVIEKHLNFLTSDHATFWYHNSSSHFPDSLNAVLLTDTGPFRGQMKKCYHSKCDDLTVLSPEKLQFAKKTADALTATLVELTSATGTGCHIDFSWIVYFAHVITLYFCSKVISKV